MNDRRKSCEERALELLADEALFGLDPGEREELDALLADLPDIDRHCMHYAAAIVQLAGLPAEPEPLPASVQRRIRFRARHSSMFE